MLCKNSKVNFTTDILYIDLDGVWSIRGGYELKELFYSDACNCITKIHIIKTKITLKTYE